MAQSDQSGTLIHEVQGSNLATAISSLHRKGWGLDDGARGIGLTKSCPSKVGLAPG